MVAVLPISTQSRATHAEHDAIIIGSGVGGSVVAATLAKHGRRVLVLEKNTSVGGILASYEKQGFKIDMGSHLISQGARGALGRALRGLGLASPRFLTHAVPVRSRGMFDIIAPAARSGLFATALEAMEKLAIPPREAAHLARLVFQVFTLTELELRAWDGRTLEEFIHTHTRHPAAYFFFSFLASIFFVLPPWEVSAGEAIRGLRRVIGRYSLSYVEGGMDRVIHALLGLVLAKDGEVVTGRAARAIRRKRRGFAVTTDDGAEYFAPVVVCNTAPMHVRELAAELDLPPDYAARLESTRGSGCAHQVKIALRRRLVDEGCLIAGVSLSGLTTADLSLDLMRRAVTSIAAGRVSDPLAIYAPVPSNYDPSIAPPGCQLIVASIYGPTSAETADAPDVWRRAILRAFEAIIPGLADELMFVDFSPVPAIGRWMGRTGNAAISNGQYPDQVGARRLSVVTPIAGLYIAGDGAGGRGIGTELAAASGMEAARAILERAQPNER